MSMQQSVKVYSYVEFDPSRNGMRVAPYKAERETILNRLGGEVLEGTALEVPREELDPQGRFRRLATGWGELS
jgi:hypothetical protein